MGDVTNEELERAGVESTSTRALKVGGISAVLVLFAVLGYFLFYKSPINATKIAKVAISKLPSDTTMPLSLAPGKKLAFVTTASRFSWSSSSQILLDVELLSQSKQVAKSACSAKTMRGSGTIHIAATHNDSCDLVVPASGADSVRIRLALADPTSSLEYDDLKVEIASE